MVHILTTSDLDIILVKLYTTLIVCFILIVFLVLLFLLSKLFFSFSLMQVRRPSKFLLNFLIIWSVWKSCRHGRMAGCIHPFIEWYWVEMWQDTLHVCSLFSKKGAIIKPNIKYNSHSKTNDENNLINNNHEKNGSFSDISKALSKSLLHVIDNNSM